MVRLAPLLLALLAGATVAQKELLRDGDFERSGKSSSPGWTHVWPQDFRPAPRFAFPREGARGGERCAEIEASYAGGFTSLTQELDLPRGASWVRFTAWARLDDRGEGGSAWTILTFVKKDLADFELRQSRRVSAVGDWEELAIESAVPEGTTRLIVRCGAFGPARARFDDVSLLAGKGDRPGVDVTLLEVESHWRVSAGAAAVAEPWLEVSVPFPFAAQTPLALRVESDPPGVVRALRVLAERENRPLVVELQPFAAGAEARISVRTLLLARRRALSDGEDADLVAGARVPEELREFLRPAAGIESEDERIRRIARGLGKRDLAEVVGDVLAFLGKEIAGGSGDQGALATLESKDAACTGHANLGAALLIAAGVPTRVLACVMSGAEQQEHYVVESWTRQLGWARIETTAKLFPVPDSLHAILRVVYPDCPRSASNVPLFWRGSDGLDVGPDLAALTKPACFQAAKELAQHALERGAADELESHARAAFEALVKAPGEGARVRLAPERLPEAVERAVGEFLAR